MAIYVANNGQLQTVKGIYYGRTEYYINATIFHNLVPKTATEIKFLYSSNNPDLTNYQKIGYCDVNNFIEIWNNGTKYIIINPRKNYIYAPASCNQFLYNYTALTDCVFDNFNTQSVSSMENMFHSCFSLTTLDISNFKTENVTHMGGMFQYCGITNLDLSSFNTRKVSNMHNMFRECSNLTSIISNTFNITSLINSSDMFYQCISLVGCNGTTYSSSHIDAEYARIDGENGLAGYFTAPTN